VDELPEAVVFTVDVTDDVERAFEQCVDEFHALKRGSGRPRTDQYKKRS
jgi:hypothetical protein